MNMSDDVTAVTLQVSMRAAEMSLNTVGHVANTVINDVARLLNFLAKTAAHGISNKIKSTNLTDIKPGEVEMSDLFQNAKRNGDSIALSENGLTKSDKKFIQSKSKEYGIPIAFTQGKNKDNIFAHVRSSDLPVFQRICTDMIKDKIATNPQNLGNFKVNDWEIPFIKNELNRHDLAAQFGKMKDGQSFCMFDKADEKAILIARGEFAQKSNSVSKEIMFDTDENGFFTIKDIRTGKETSFEKDKLPSYDELSSSIQIEFGYDENKANLTCSRFGQEQLIGEDKAKFFSENPQNSFSKIETNIKLKDENIFTTPYTCLRVTPNSDKNSHIVYQAQNGRFAVISPEKMSKGRMSAILSESLGITDKNEIKALIEKAEKVTSNYAKQDIANYSYSYEFSKSDFDMTNPDVVKNMKRTDEAGNIFTKNLPVDKINVDIERIDKNKFKVTSNATSIETDINGAFHPSTDTQTNLLSFSDKKSAINELMSIYKAQGIPEMEAKQMAKETFKKAENQNAEKVLIIEELRTEKPYYYDSTSKAEIDISCGNKKETISISDLEKAKAEISDKFEVSNDMAETIIDKTDDVITERQIHKLDELGFKNAEDWTKQEASDMIGKIEKNGWHVPGDINPSEFKPDSMMGSVKDLIDPKNILTDKVPELPKLHVPNISRGGR